MGLKETLDAAAIYTGVTDRDDRVRSTRSELLSAVDLPDDEWLPHEWSGRGKMLRFVLFRQDSVLLVVGTSDAPDHRARWIVSRELDAPEGVTRRVTHRTTVLTPELVAALIQVWGREPNLEISTPSRIEHGLLGLVVKVVPNLATAAVLWLLANGSGLISTASEVTTYITVAAVALLLVLFIVWVRRYPRLLWAVRALANLLNLSTPIGLGLATLGHADLVITGEWVVIARGYRSRFPAPRAMATTVGNVVLLRMSDEAAMRFPGLLLHESRHTTHWAWCLGLPYVPLYLAASLLSWFRSGDFALRNPFEVNAGLADGGYIRRPDANRQSPPGSPGTPWAVASCVIVAGYLAALLWLTLCR